MAYASTSGSTESGATKVTPVSFTKPYSVTSSSTVLSGKNLSAVSTANATDHAVPVTGMGGLNGKSAFQLAVDTGFTGTLEQWLDSLEGPPGQDNVENFTVTLGVGVGGETAITLDSQNRGVVLDVTQSSNCGKPALITIQAGTAGSVVAAQTSGLLDYPPSNLVPEKPVYVGLGGQLTQTLPLAAKFALIIGSAVSSNKIFVQMQPAIQLA